MEQDIQVRQKLESQIRELYGRTVWTHKTQEKCADILKGRNHWLKITQIFLSALTTTGILITLFGDNRNVAIASAVVSAILLFVNTYFQKYDLGEISEKHSKAASDIWKVREDYLSILTDLVSGDVPVNQIRDRRDKLSDELVNIYKGAPRTISKAYKEATKALKENEELTFSDSEIDKILPTELKKEKVTTGNT